MHITSEQEIDSKSAKILRAEFGLTQSEFWGRVGVQQSQGSYLESNLTISKPLRILLFVNYVAGINLDVSTPEGVARLLKLAQRQPGAGKRAASEKESA